jgi:hypothetical protein
MGRTTMPSLVLHKVISGGQTGAGQGAWRAAQAFGVATGGDPSSAEQNVQDADATLWFGATTTASARQTVAACLRLGKPCLPVSPGVSFEPSHVANWIAENHTSVLNVAGNHEIEEPGLGAQVEPFLIQVLEQLGHERT